MRSSQLREIFSQYGFARPGYQSVSPAPSGQDERWQNGPPLWSHVAGCSFVQEVCAMFEKLSGLSANKAATELNRRGIPTATGRQWTAVQAIRVRERLS